MVEKQKQKGQNKMKMTEYYGCLNNKVNVVPPGCSVERKFGFGMYKDGIRLYFNIFHFDIEKFGCGGYFDLRGGDLKSLIVFGGF
jgi:hypothetical protein